jgi:hypothetical protein
MFKGPTYYDFETQIPETLRDKEVVLGATFNTGVESSCVAINEHNELELKHTLPEFFTNLAALVNRSLSFFFIIEHHPSRAAYQTHCHGFCTTLSTPEMKVAEELWVWHYHNHNFLDAYEELSVSLQKTHRVKWSPPHLFFKEHSPVKNTIQYALKECSSYETVSTIEGTVYSNFRLNQKWYNFAKPIYQRHTLGHWLEVVDKTTNKGASLDSFNEFAMCYLLAFRNQVNSS